MIWLALAHDHLSLPDLQGDLLSLESKSQVLNTLESLQRRSLLQVSEQGYRLQPVCADAITHSLVDHLYAELLAAKPMVLKTHTLITTRAPQSIQRLQTRSLLQPLIEKIQLSNDPEEIFEKVKHLQEYYKDKPPIQRGYCPLNCRTLLDQVQRSFAPSKVQS
jgi:hypothetical protein